jgi:hypothetical protein
VSNAKTSDIAKVLVFDDPSEPWETAWVSAEQNWRKRQSLEWKLCTKSWQGITTYPIDCIGNNFLTILAGTPRKIA